MQNKLQQFLTTYPIRVYGKGQVILRPEHEENSIYFIMSGFVRAHTITEEGNEFSAVLLGQGMYFPIFRYLSDHVYTKKLTTKYYYSTVTETKIVTINNTDLFSFLSSNPQIAIEMSDIYYLNMKQFLSKLEFMSYTHSAYKKVCYFLVFLSKKFGEETQHGMQLIPPFTHKEFATFVGLSRESVSHQLSLLKKRNIIDELRQTICIRKMHQLENELRR